MSKTLLTTADVPAYIREIVQHLRLTTDDEEQDLPGYTFKLYGKHKIGYEDQLKNNCEKLLKWCQRYYADAYIVSEHFWWTDVAPFRSDDFYTKEHRRKAYREGFRNYIKVVITDPVAHRFEQDDYYKVKSVFPIITKPLQEAFERNVAGSPDETPCICGYYGRACRQMNDPKGADRAICTSCPLAQFGQHN